MDIGLIINFNVFEGYKKAYRVSQTFPKLYFGYMHGFAVPNSRKLIKYLR
jgi:hypothetical protein